MMRSRFDEQLDTLNRELITMGALCENAIARSAKALTEQDVSLARTVTELAAQIDQKEREIEGLCLKLLLQQQPVATDLRVISAALKMVTDMERIGDNSGDIGEIITVADLTPADEGEDISAMARSVIKMVTDSIDAFVKKDVSLAQAVVDYDDVVDSYFTRVKTTLIQRLRSAETDAEQALDMLMIVKYLERIGDHAVNIARWVVFSITGERGVAP